MVKGHYRIRLRRKLAIGLAIFTLAYSPLSQGCASANETLESLMNCLFNRSSEQKSKKEIAETYGALFNSKFGLQTPYFMTELTSERIGYTNDEATTLNYNTKESTKLDLGFKGRSQTFGLDYSLSLLQFSELKLQNQKWYQTLTDVSLKLNLLKGAGYYVGNLQSQELETDFNYKRQELESTKLVELRALLNAYVDFSLVLRQLEILDSIVDGHEQRVNNLQSLEKLGRASGLNLLSAQAQLAASKVEQARLKQENIRYKQTLCEVLNINYSECKIQKLKPLDYSNWIKKNENLDGLARKDRETTELKLLKLEIEKSEILINTAENEARPELDLILKRQLKSHLADENKIHYARNGYEDIIGISFMMPLDNSYNNAKTNIQKAERNKLVRDYKKIQMQNELNVGLTGQVLTSAKIELSLAEERQKYSQQRLNTAIAGHKSGSVNLKDLLDYESEQKEASLQLEQSKANLTRSVLDFVYLNQESQFLEFVKSQ